MMGNINEAKEEVKLLIFTAPTRLRCMNFAIKHAFNKRLKFSKVFKHLRFMTKQINQCKLIVIINKANMVFLASKGINGRSPYIKENKLQRCSGTTSGDVIR
jgi:hypothetical protein